MGHGSPCAPSSEEEEEEEEKIMIDSMRSTPCWIANQGVK
jgi:hypothetical protein